MNEQRHDHGNPTLRLLVDALQDVSSLRTAYERHLVLDLLRHKLGNGFHVREYPETRAHLFSIAQTCGDRRGGLIALAETLRDLEPGSLAVAKACRLIDDMSPLDLVADFDREQLLELLSGIELPQLDELCRRALGAAAPRPAPGRARLVDVLSWLEQQNARADGVPPTLVFVEELAAGVDNGLAAKLRWWADRQAARMGLGSRCDPTAACPPRRRRSPWTGCTCCFSWNAIWSTRTGTCCRTGGRPASCRGGRSAARTGPAAWPTSSGTSPS
ncbi:hypothetical protein [Kutzneria sp. NPDC051319]|uniref:effector-associated domain 2-containing protein n=1 Tax=Kutzneria sp. NPDC051319 TaxID=3155047 RepID=UPI003448626B